MASPSLSSMPPFSATMDLPHVGFFVVYAKKVSGHVGFKISAVMVGVLMYFEKFLAD